MAARGTILVLEDDPDIADLVRQALAGAGYRVLLAASVPAARDVLGAFRVGLVIADALSSVGDADPWAALTPLLRAAGPTPVVLSTAHQPGRYADYAARGFAATLPKPFDLDQLLNLAASFLLPGDRPGVVELPIASEG